MDLDAPSKKLEVFMVDLSLLSPLEYEENEALISEYSFICQQVPGKQVLKVFWNADASISSLFNLPQSWVTPWPYSN